ncbi:MAG: thioredoxin [Pseudomonadota bacterium]
MTTKVTEQTFATEVLQADQPVLVDLWAEWCAPCRSIAPILEELEADFGGQLKVAKINIDENPELATQLQVRSIPTLLLFVGGELVDSTVGVQPKQALTAFVEARTGVAA